MAKGGAYENIIAKQLAVAFKPLRIKPGDVGRTKNSGASKDCPGDIHLSPAFLKILPAVIECKYYKKLPFFRICIPLHLQNKTLISWWKQVTKDTKKAKRPKRFSLLVFRVNFCGDVVAFKPEQINDMCPELIIKKAKFRNIIKTSWKEDTVWMVPLLDFLDHFVAMRLLTCRSKSVKR
jgi:hypothetical protein